MENIFYVYLHRRKTDGKVFYVGKGKDKRAYVKASRSQWWKSVADKHGTDIEIVFDNLSEEDALEIEKDTILEFRYFGHPLVNLTDGGEGMSGYKQPEEQKRKVSAKMRGKKKTPEQIIAMKITATKAASDFNISEKYKGSGNPNADKSVYIFIHTVSGVMFNGTRSEFCVATRIRPRSLNGLFRKEPTLKTCFGWKLQKENNDTET